VKAGDDNGFQAFADFADECWPAGKGEGGKGTPATRWGR
jgi:hypothetical protein